MQRSSRSTRATPARRERPLGRRPQVEDPVACQVGVEAGRDLGPDLVAARPDRRPDDRAPSARRRAPHAARSTTPSASPRQPAWTTRERRRAAVRRGDRDRQAVGRQREQRQPGLVGPERVAVGSSRATRARAVHGRRVPLPVDGEARRVEPERSAGAPPVLGDARRVVAAAAEVERGERPLAHAAVARREGDDVRPGRVPADHEGSSSSARASSASRRLSAGSSTTASSSARERAAELRPGR